MPGRKARLVRLVTASAVGALVFTLSPALSGVASADELPPGRELVGYTVKPGDTATGLAVKYHAWTRELISYNDLGSDGRLRVGQRIRIPVVTAAAGSNRPARSAETKKSAKGKAGRTERPRATSTSWQTRPSRAAVRRIIVRTAQGHGVDPHLALAVSWQEAGWQMHHVSSANAIGAMQVLPGTGDWMEAYAGRSLDLRNVYDNVAAGVLLLKVLDQQTSSTTQQVAAYYQGLGAVRRHGLYRDTGQYVRNVKALRSRLAAGWNPA